MKPRRTEYSTNALTLPGGNEDNYLWIYVVKDTIGYPVICSVWEPTPEERMRIANGENIRLQTWGISHPPVDMEVTDEKLGKKKTA